MSRSALDLTGRHFGDLEVIERAGSTPRGAALWRCVCHRCGGERIIEGHRFNGKRPPRDCGCRRKEQTADLSGQTFGALTVVERRGSYKSGDKLYLCRCAVCGQEKLIPKSTIKACPRSCGCLHYEPERMKKASSLGLEANLADVGGTQKADIQATRSCKATASSKTGVRNVFPESGRSGQYRVAVQVAGECVVRTGFLSIEEATKARDQIKHDLLEKYGLNHTEGSKMYSIQNIVETIKAAKQNGYRFFGIRTISEEAEWLNIGDRCPDSYNWDMENDCSTFCTTGETLNGACAVRVYVDDLYLDGGDDDEAAEAVEKAMNASSRYYGREAVLIGSKDGYEDGWDQDEVILENAEVLGILE